MKCAQIWIGLMDRRGTRTRSFGTCYDIAEVVKRRWERLPALEFAGKKRTITAARCGTTSTTVEDTESDGKGTDNVCPALSPHNWS